MFFPWRKTRWRNEWVCWWQISALQGKTKVCLFCYLCSFGACSITIIAWVLVVSSHKAPAAGRAVPIPLRCSDSSMASGGAVKWLAEGHAGGRHCGSGAGILCVLPHKGFGLQHWFPVTQEWIQAQWPVLLFGWVCDRKNLVALSGGK